MNTCKLGKQEWSSLSYMERSGYLQTTGQTSVSLAPPANKERKEMFFAFRNFILAKATYFYFNFTVWEILTHFCFLSNFMVWLFSSIGFIMLIFYFRKIAQIIVDLYFWSLFCLSKLKLRCSDLTWQPEGSEFNHSIGRSAEIPGTAQTGNPSLKKNQNSVFWSYGICCDTSTLPRLSSANNNKICIVFVLTNSNCNTEAKGKSPSR